MGLAAAIVLLAAALAFAGLRAGGPTSPRVAAPVVCEGTGQRAALDGVLPTVADDAPAPRPAPPGMVWIPGGEFSMGLSAGGPGGACSSTAGDDAVPIHRVRVSGFWMDATEVTNAEFERFVQATGYVTVAERAPRPEDAPGVPQALLVPGGAVFTPTSRRVGLADATAWWRYVPGAQWRRPTGPGSDLVGREAYPVVQVAWDDAVAYATWAGKRLPTEAEWEFAARGGLSGALLAWGGELRPGGVWRANLYQGDFPQLGGDRAEDGSAGCAPVRSYPPNGYGLYDVTGNVWEWCSDWYRADTYAQRAGRGVVLDPTGPAASHDPLEPGVPKRVQRGGSFLCSDLYCTRYLMGTRGRGEVGTSSDHVGFRCAKSP